ncbi:hypothetical protein Trydic_g22993 [Trypoxylus dichotomus]
MYRLILQTYKSYLLSCAYNRRSSTEHLMDALRESAVSYGAVKRWCCESKCGRQSCIAEHADGTPTTATTQETVKKIHDIVLQDCRVSIRQLVEDADLS